MSVRVVARIRPLLEKELDKDIIVHAASTEDGKPSTLVRIPSPKNGAEEFTFAFNSVYDSPTTQEELFSAEVAPHLKALFQGLDVTLFAYGVTGTGKTHTMRGGMKLAERGVIPRLLSSVFRRSKKIAKDTSGGTTVSVALSYYEIYNDKVFDLLEPPEKRTPAGLPLREANGKTHVVGLSERPCEDLKDFEKLYIESNLNRVTASTKLNAHSSRSHAILRVKVTQVTEDGGVLESTASAIDLAGSEDNRRTDNGKERLVESAAINKSLFVLSQCIDAISRGDRRIPFRESKMTRILSLGQNNGITVMILNLAPLRSYHLDTLSSLNVSSRAKRIEVREIENEIVYKQVPRTNSGNIQGVARQPLRPLANAHNVHAGAVAAKEKEKEKAATDRPVKLFNVYTDRSKPPVPAKPTIPVAAPTAVPRPANTAVKRSAVAVYKRPGDSESGIARPSKITRPVHTSLPQPSKPAIPPSPSAEVAQPAISADLIEAMVEKKVAEILASRSQQAPAQSQPEISDAVQKRLDALERRIEDGRHDDSKSDGLRFLLMARQHKERGEDAMKLLAKMEKLQLKLAAKAEGKDSGCDLGIESNGSPISRKKKVHRQTSGEDYDTSEAVGPSLDDTPLTPHMQELLDIINSKDLSAIMGLQGFGPKKARDLVDHLSAAADEEDGAITSLAQLRAIPGMGGRAVERAYEGLVADRA
ncbi:kinesin family member 22 [Apiospora phragmitis]|uniref:Kinesin-like protein KIF22 n=1 Tax=Apiospora phragmitis TaxID=2905665 RepID=A0ABR1TUI9_9PEZI